VGSRSKVESTVLRIAEEVATSLGLEIYDLVFRRTGPRWKLQVFLVRADGTVGLDECAILSRALSRELDLCDPIEQAYDLEVSSPGLERTLRTRRHWAQARGERAKLRWRDASGAVQSAVGIISGEAQGVVTVQPDTADSPLDIPFESILSARLQVDWSAGRKNANQATDTE